MGIGHSLPGSDFQLQDSLAMKLTTIKIKKKKTKTKQVLTLAQVQTWIAHILDIMGVQ